LNLFGLAQIPMNIFQLCLNELLNAKLGKLNSCISFNLYEGFVINQEKHEFISDSLRLLYNSGKCLSKRRRSITYTPFKTLTFEESLAQYGNDPRYELIDGELRDRYPTGPHAG